MASDGPLYGFSGEKKEVEGGADLLVTLGDTSLKCRFVIVDAPSCYKAIFGRPLLNVFKAVPSSYHQCLKYCKGDVQVRIRSDPRAARECYLSAVSTIIWMADAEQMERMLGSTARLEAAEEVEEIEVLSEAGVPGLLKIGGSERTQLHQLDQMTGLFGEGATILYINGSSGGSTGQPVWPTGIKPASNSTAAPGRF